MALHIQRFAGVPSTVPKGIGHHFIDTANRNAYISVGTTSVADWIINAESSTSFTNFLALLDTPSAYTDKGGFLLKINDAETGIEFISGFDLGSSTGLLTGSVITINDGDPAKADVEGGFIVVADAFTDPLNPFSNIIPYGPFEAVTLPNLATAASTEFYILTNGTLLLESGIPFDIPTTRTRVPIGAAVHTGVTQIDFILDVYVGVATAYGNALMDLMLIMGGLNQNGGNVYTPNGANLKIDKSAGNVLFFGANYKVNRSNPNIPPQPAGTEVPFIYTWQDGSGGWNSTFNTDVNVVNYDDASGGASVPDGVVGNNNYSIQPVCMSVQGNTLIYFGQVTYSTLALAANAIRSQVFLTNPEFQGAIFRSWMIVKKDTTALNDTAQNTFTKARKFDTLD